MMAVLKRLLIFTGSVLIPLVFVVQGTFLFVLAERGELDGGTVQGWGRWLIVGPVLAPVLMLGLMAAAVYDIWHIVTNCRLTNRCRVAWICAIFLANVFVLPIYWLVHLRRADKGDKPVQFDGDLLKA